uniref:Uncharacterized protein n=1 Tax=Megaselia scalaris TaxID=36166 RepID=T1GHX9_MEGSC
MEYLKTYLDGEPAKLISSYLLSGNNYKAAFKALDKIYNNKCLLVSIHIDNMMKPFGGSVTSDTIKEMYDNINGGLIAISNMGSETNSWGYLIVHFALEILDDHNRALFGEEFIEVNEETNER